MVAVNEKASDVTYRATHGATYREVHRATRGGTCAIYQKVQMAVAGWVAQEATHRATTDATRRATYGARGAYPHRGHALP